MIAPIKIPKPDNWQDFELLCKKLWGEIWECPSIKKNGRLGQGQDGVDIYGFVKSRNAYCGIQCKAKDEYTNSQLTKNEVDAEIFKATRFEPKLKYFIIATTANKDADIEKYIRKKNVESIDNGSFEIDLYCWEDIVDLLRERKSIYDWYVNNCQFINKIEVEVSFQGEKTLTIYPQYKRIRHITKILPPLDPNNLTDMVELRMEQIQAKSICENLVRQHQIVQEALYGIPSKTDYTICYPEITIKNIGTIAIEDYKLDIWLDGTDFVGDCFHYVNAPILDPAERATINANKDQNREVFKSKEYCNEVFYKPQNTVLVPNEQSSFEFSLIPSEGTDTIILHWQLLSRHGSVKGENTIYVRPHYIDLNDIKKTRNPEDYKDEYITIEPRIE